MSRDLFIVNKINMPRGIKWPFSKYCCLFVDIAAASNLPDLYQSVTCIEITTLETWAVPDCDAVRLLRKHLFSRARKSRTADSLGSADMLSLKSVQIQKTQFEFAGANCINQILLVVTHLLAAGPLATAPAQLLLASPLPLLLRERACLLSNVM